MNDSQLDQQDGGLKDDKNEVQLSAGERSDVAADWQKNVKPEGDGDNLWDKAKRTAGEAAEEIKNAFDPNSGDPATRRDYR